MRTGKVTVTFDHADGGLQLRAPIIDAHGDRTLGAATTDGPLLGFAIAGADGKFVWAEARVVGSQVVVWSDAVPQPVAVRYAWGNSPLNLNLYNGAGLPAAPFRTDR